MNQQANKGPKVSFKSKEEIKMVGTWLDILKPDTDTIKASTRKYIRQEFSDILGSIGFSPKRTCRIEKQESRERQIAICHIGLTDSVKLHLTNSYRRNDEITSYPSISVDTGSAITTHQVIIPNNSAPIRTRVYKHSKINRPTYVREYSECFAKYFLYDDYNKLILTIEKPDYIVAFGEYIPGEEEAFRTCLGTMTFPQTIENIYRRIASSFIAIEEYPKVEIEHEQTFDDDRKPIVNMITVDRGNLKSFTITRGDKVVSATKSTWSVTTNGVTISKNIDSYIGPKGRIKSAEKEVEKATETIKRITFIPKQGDTNG